MSLIMAFTPRFSWGGRRHDKPELRLRLEVSGGSSPRSAYVQKVYSSKRIRVKCGVVRAAGNKHVGAFSSPCTAWGQPLHCHFAFRAATAAIVLSDWHRMNYDPSNPLIV